MATRASDVAKLQKRVAALEQKMRALEAELTRRGILAQPAPAVTRPPATRQLWADLLEKGIIRLPTPAELSLAAEWQALTETEKHC